MLATAIIAVGLSAALLLSGTGTQVLGEALIGVAKVRASRSDLVPLSIGTLPERSTIVDADGNVLARLYLENRVAVRYDDIPQVMIDAILSAEDRRFFDHDGVDPVGVMRAAKANVSGENRQGASTITQQYVKNLLIAQATTPEERRAAQAPTADRKLDELWYATNLETRYSKEQILEGYLNTVYFGEQTWGLGAAAAHYFSTPVQDLTVTQAALLAGLVQSPSAYAPSANPDVALTRRNEVLDGMRATGAITDEQHAAAVAAPLGLQVSTTTSGCAASTAPFFCDFVRNQLESDPALGDTREERISRLTEGGLTITTTLDPEAQAAAQWAVADPLGPDDRVGVSSVSVEPGTGKIRALAVNRFYGTDEAANQTTVDLANAPIPSGSTFKVFTLAAALESGIPPDTVLPGGARYTSRLDNPADGSFTNYEGESLSNVSLAEATKHSVNTAYVQLEERVGVRAVAEMINRLGITTVPLEGPGAVGEREASLTLGARSVSPVEMAAAYATFAAGGVWCRPTAIESVIDGDGQPLSGGTDCQPVLDAGVADTVTSMLRGVVQGGTGTAAAVPGHDVAGKTGTTQDYGSAWFVGYTNQLATAVAVADPRGISYTLHNVAGVRSVTGGSIPARVFSAAMTGELAALEGGGAPPAADQAPVAVMPDVVGLPAPLARARLADRGREVDGIDGGVVKATVPAAGQPLTLRRITLLGDQP